MSISPRAGRRGLYKLPLLLLLPVAAGVSGCANPGPPKPPSLNLPSPVKDLRAERTGNQVRLAWTNPTATTDDAPIKPPLSAEICRDAGSTSLPTSCTVVQHLAAHSGPATAVDLLPAPLLADPVQLLRYRVRILNASARAADASNVAFAAAGAAPAPIAGLQSSPSSAGTRILWQPEISPAAEVILQRTATASAAPSPASARPAAARPAAARPFPARPSPAPAGQHKQTPPPPVQLQASASGSDQGGTIDASAQRGTTYSYIAWRTRSVMAGGKSVAIRSQDSAPLVVTAQDTTPPATPAGLEAIADAASVDLSWEPDTDADLAGYWVERADLPNADAPSGSESWQRVNQTLLSAPAYRDTPPPAAHDLRYRILAVDITGNLSRPTPSVSVRLRADPAP